VATRVADQGLHRGRELEDGNADELEDVEEVVLERWPHTRVSRQELASP
jgi:hypothetical protein